MGTTRRAVVIGTVAALVTLGLAGCTGRTGGHGAAAATGSDGGSAARPGGSGITLQSAFEKVVSRVLPSIVQITSSTGLGSGVVFDGKGDIVTNAHVVGSDHSFQVSLATGGAALPAALVASYPPDDLAVIRLEKPPGSLKAATFADSSKIKVGELAMAMGNPLGLSGSVTEGIVSGTGRTVSEPRSPDSPGATIADAIQTSAAINPGNSGGALVDLDGHVIGVPTLAATDPQVGGVAPGIGFAIPSNTVTSIAKQIVRDGKVVASNRAALEVTVRTVVDASGQPAGAGVVKVAAGGAADRAGIRPGDVITGIDGTRIRTADDLAATLAHLAPNDKAKVTVVRPDGGGATVTVTLGQLR